MNWLLNPAVLWPIGIALGLGFLVVLNRMIERWRDAWPGGRADNGIRVGAPKVYDNRSLSLMLEQLEAQLQAVQSIDAGTIRSAIGTQQGERRTETTAALDVHLTAAPKPAPADAAKTAEPGSRKDDTVSPRDLPSPPADPTSFKWSERALDLLNDQVGLSYEIFNLRLLLERALSDRLQGNLTRLQAVIGVPISIDPPPYATGCAATVELKIPVRASLVALFPQQETFNTWGVDRRRFQVSAGVQAAANASGSGTLQRAEQSSFLRRHAEVVAMERESAVDELIVAWQFRPAPGARTVAAGLRQMLMVIALPDADVGEGTVPLQASVRSSWQRWHAGSETAGSGVGWPAFLTNRITHYAQWGPHIPFEVPTTGSVERHLRPDIASVEWARIGSEKAAIIVKGEHFFTGTTVALGDTVIAAEPGLTLKSERSMQIIAPIDSLMTDAVLNGRYGPSTRLIKAPPPAVSVLRIAGASIQPSPSRDSCAVELQLATRRSVPLNWERFRDLPDPIFSINGRVVPDLLAFDPHATLNFMATAYVRVAADFVPDRATRLILRWPFYGDDWTLHYQTYDPNLQVFAYRYTAANQLTDLLFSGVGFDPSAAVILDRVYSIAGGDLTLLGPDLLKLELPTALLGTYSECFIQQAGSELVRVSIPQLAPAAVPSLDLSKKPPLLTLKTGVTIDLAGAGLDTVTQVVFDGAVLPFVPYASGAAVSVAISADAIRKRGKREIRLVTQSGATLRAPVLVA